MASANCTVSEPIALERCVVGVPMHEVPITSITNGVHTKTWMAAEFGQHFIEASAFAIGGAPG